MPEYVSIPIAVFELVAGYVRPDVKLWIDRGAIVQSVFEAFAPWGPNLDDIEAINEGKPSEQGMKLKLPAQKVTFYFGAAGCRFTKEGATWEEVDETITILDTALKVLTQTAGVNFGKKVAILSLHLQPKTVSFQEILRPFLAPEIAKLEGAPADALAIIARWKGRRITLDGSRALANGVFVQSEREFEGAVSYKDLKAAVRSDELALFKLLGVEEAAS